MKFKKVLALGLVGAMAISMAACGKTSSSTDNGGSGNAGTSNETVSLRVWGGEEDQNLLKELVEKFKKTYPDQKFDIEIGVESESTAKDTVLTDVEAAADVFAFASDQIVDLNNAKALANIEDMDAALQNYAKKSVADIKAANGDGSVEAASIDGKLMAFPMTGGNGYFLYYDSSVISDEDAATWDTLLAAADKAGKKVGMTLASGWYNASFFYGAGFTTGLNDDGTTAIDFNGTSKDGYTGVQVTQSMLNIASNKAFMAIADGDVSNQIAGGTLAAVISGTWDAENAQKVFGDGYAAAKLPTYTLDGKQVQQGSVSGYKFLGVNAYSKNVGWATVLAEFLTNEESQATRFEQRQLAPTNKKVAASDEVSKNVAIAASAAQDAYGVIQTVSAKYWDPAKTFGEMIAQGSISATDEKAIQDALDTMVEGAKAAVE
ncbi:MAG TPA: extracellular solute-binding protein [Lachnospiraceae bacterium]|jgi:arabinogalactan oligomer/maltooligosaccharide transport system substrate-binding protein|nr:putative bacterial extracellular solute-binding protein [Butyrivibrio sp. CAG:318]HJI31002.1 extracellular solute-binding protein [Lachnospiraceae bacterium]